MFFSYYHSWFIAIAGIIISSYVGFKNLQKNNVPYSSSLIIIISAIYISLFSGRFIYLFKIHPKIIYTNPEYILDLWKNDGIIILVPLILLISGGIIFLINKKPILSKLGSITPAIATMHLFLLLIVYWNENFIGTESSLPWSTFSHHMQKQVHPTAIYLIICEILTLIVIQKMWNNSKNRKLLLPIYGIIACLSRIFIDFFNGGNPGVFQMLNLNSNQVFSIILFIIFSIIIILLLKKYLFLIIPSLLLVAFFSVTIYSTNIEDNKDKNISTAEEYLILTRTVFSTEIADFIKFKEKEGYFVTLKSWNNPPDAEEVKTWIKNNFNGSYILIVGDSAVETEKNFNWHMPSNKVKFNEKNFFSDQLFGDISIKGIPKIPVGRIPVHNKYELNEWIEKIRKHYDQKKFSQQKRLFCWYNSEELPGISNELSKTMTDGISTYILSPGNDSSKKIPIEKHDQAFLDQVNFPYIISMIVTHGYYNTIIPYKNNKKINISVKHIENQPLIEPAGIMIILSCDTGNFILPSNKGDSLAEAFFHQYNWPIGIIAATDKTSPITNYFFAKSLVHNLKSSTIGKLFLEIQKDISKLSKKVIIDDPNVDFLKKSYPDTPSRDMIILDLLKYNILGDPSIKIEIE